MEVPHLMFHWGVKHMLPCKKQLSLDACLDQELLPPHSDISPIYKHKNVMKVSKSRNKVYHFKGNHLTWFWKLAFLSTKVWLLGMNHWFSHQKQQSCYWKIFVKLPNIFVSLSPISISCIKAPLLSFKCWERRKVFWYYIKLLNCSKHVQFKNLHKPRWKNSNTSFCALLIISLSEKNRRPKKRGKKTPRQVKTILKQPLEGIENDCKSFTHGCNNAAPLTHPLFQIQTHWFLSLSIGSQY